MLDHIILTVSDIKRSLAFYEAALKPLNIKFFMPYEGGKIDEKALKALIRAAVALNISVRATAGPVRSRK